MDWHARYTAQAAWTRDLRHYLFRNAGLSTARCVLEVGCGTGAILSEISSEAALHGLDLDPLALNACGKHAPAALRTLGNALFLPYPRDSFDIVFCHFLLLWVPDPLRVVVEMKRVARPGGHVLALAEPDYTARVDRPSALAPLGRWQAESLRRRGADPALGAHLAEIFFQAGLQIVETGTIQAGKGERLSPSQRGSEWAVLESDLAGSVSSSELNRLKALDEAAWLRGERVLHVPTYFAWGHA